MGETIKHVGKWTFHPKKTWPTSEHLLFPESWTHTWGHKYPITKPFVWSIFRWGPHRGNVYMFTVYWYKIQLSDCSPRIDLLAEIYNLQPYWHMESVHMEGTTTELLIRFVQRPHATASSSSSSYSASSSSSPSSPKAQKLASVPSPSNLNIG